MSSSFARGYHNYGIRLISNMSSVGSFVVAVKTASIINMIHMRMTRCLPVTACVLCIH